jgi:hypothetical protein
MNERMTYAQWTALTADEQNSIPDEKLPEIPQEQLTNKLTRAICKRVNGEIGWELTQTFSATESSTKWFPAYSLRKVMSQEIWYKLDPTFGTYSMNLTGAEPSLEEEPIGVYGMKWMNFMQEQHPDLVDVMQFHGNYLTVARSVDRSAQEYREILDSQYEQANPRPTESYEEIRKWETTRAFYTDSTVMRERVLIPITTP